jgi:hypothetical protein
MPTPPQPDPTLQRRAHIARWCEVGQRVGYGLFGAAIAVFVYGAISGFVQIVVTAVVTLLAVGSVVLAPAIVFGYGVKAADREDRERRSTRGSN